MKLVSKPALRARVEPRKPEPPKRPPGTGMLQFSKLITAAVMLTHFVGVGLGVYCVVRGLAPLIEVLDYIKILAVIDFLGYFIKAFGENIAKIALPFVYGGKNNSAGEPDE